MAMFSPFSALTAAAGGFASNYQDQQAKAYDLMGMQALGNAFKQIQGPIAPIPGIGPQGPQAPPPGQPSQPSQPMQPPTPIAPPGPQMAAALPSGGAMPPGGVSASPSPGGPPPGGGGIMPGGGEIIGGGTATPGGPTPPVPAGGGLPQLDLQTMIQRINQANPGLPPQALVSALTRAAPLLNLQGKQELALMRQQMQAENLNLRRDALDLRRDLGERRLDAAEEKTASSKSEAQDIVDAMKRGDQPPTMTGLYRLAPEVRAIAAKQGVDLAKMQQEWSRAQKQILSLNGPQMVRYQGLAHSVVNTIDEVNRLAAEMDNSGIPLLNHAKMVAYAQTQGNSPQGQLVARYLAGINTLKEEFANLAQGGYAPTEAAWGLANAQINGDYGVKQLGASLGEVQRLIRYRLEGIPGIGTLGTDAPNRYVPGGTGSKQSQDPLEAAKDKLRQGMTPAGGGQPVDLGGGWSAQRVQ